MCHHFTNVWKKMGKTKTKQETSDGRKLVGMFRSHQGSSLTWSGNCCMTSASVHSEDSVT